MEPKIPMQAFSKEEKQPTVLPSYYAYDPKQKLTWNDKP